jgi:hypothetical protein
MSRSIELLKIARECFKEQRDIFSIDELVRNHITADECFELSNAIAEAIGFFSANKKLYLEWKKQEIMAEIIKETKLTERSKA